MKIFYSLFLIFFFICFLPLHAENDNHGTDTPVSSRIEATQKLPDKVVDFVSSQFILPPSVVREKYDIGKVTELPSAIEKAFKEDQEEPLSKIVSQLMGVVNLKQLPPLLAETAKVLEAEKTDPEKTDPRYVVFLERLQWAAKMRLKEEIKDEKADKFVAQFKKDYEKTKEWNRTANEKLAQAAQGNAQAKQWLRDNISMKSILGFAEAQKKSGNQEIGSTIFRALRTPEGNLDMYGAGAEQQRIYGGKTDASFDKAVDIFLKQKTFGTNVAARKSFETPPQKAWYVSNDGKLTSGTPPDFVSPTQSTRTETNGAAAQNNIPDMARLRAYLSSTSTPCMNCHTLTLSGTSVLNATLSANGKPPVQLKDLPLIFERIPGMKNLPPEVKKTVLDWAEIQRRGK